MGLDDSCINTCLDLGLGFKTPLKITQSFTKKKLSFRSFEPSLTLGFSSEYVAKNGIDENSKEGICEENFDDLYKQASDPHSGVSSLSNNVTIKRERDHGNEEIEVERVSSRVNDEDEDCSNTRKKLRLTKEQSALLEESFKQHSTLHPNDKQALASQLNLQPRQVEVWFQNRRARTKLKQTEVDCEYLKKCCETLTDENRRLQKEIQELKALKLSQPFYMQLPAATLTMCPSCERLGRSGNIAGDGPPKTSFTIASNKPLFYNPFTNPSAAC